MKIIVKQSFFIVVLSLFIVDFGLRSLTQPTVTTFLMTRFN
jgi:hypothetical protein